MASRVLYGLGKRGWAPAWLAAVNDRTRTPLIATFLVTATSILLALSLPIGRLAEGTSILTLSIFLVVNLSLVIQKARTGGERPAFSVPIIVPILGTIVCAGLILAAFL